MPLHSSPSLSTVFTLSPQTDGEPTTTLSVDAITLLHRTWRSRCQDLSSSRKGFVVKISRQSKSNGNHLFFSPLASTFRSIVQPTYRSLIFFIWLLCDFIFCLQGNRCSKNVVQLPATIPFQQTATQNNPAQISNFLINS